MSGTDKIKVAANEAADAIKQGVGKMVGSAKLEVEGAVEKIKGKAEIMRGDVKDAVKKTVDKM
jgi:uncharacterized protein YjbJ (UPF0337 family)